ncbi:MAG: hypothetical protein BWK78_05370, partial [Thiotrichaceae bacterium IS1]
TDDHYLDFLLHVHPELELAVANSSEVEKHLHNVRSRREHVHVWDSQTFKTFLVKTLELLNIQADCVFEVTGEENQFESFSVWQKQTTQQLLPQSYYKVLARVLEVSKPNPGHPALWGFAIDSPVSGMIVNPSYLTVTGWALGRTAPVVTIEITDESLDLSTHLPFKITVCNGVRPDIANEFPAVAEADHSGFVVGINLPRSSQETTQLGVTAVLANQQRIKLIDLKLQRFLLPLSPPAKPKIAFIHIPKTAGTSLRHLVEQEYPLMECLYWYEEVLYLLDKFDKKYLKTLLKGSLFLAKALYGHFPFSIHETLDISCQYVTFLRHPLDLVVSLYNHAANDPSSPFYADIRAGMSLLEMLSNEQWGYNNNSMTRIIINRVREADGTIPECEDLSISAEVLELIDQHFLFIGLTERLSEGVAVLGKLLDWKQPYEIPSLNVTANKRVQELDAKTRVAIEEHNRLDIMLYEHFRQMEKGYFVNERLL